MNKKPTLFIMVGVPGSGKSHFLTTQNFPSDKFLIVSRDKVRFSMISDKDEYFSKEKQVFKEFVNQIQKGLDNGKSVFADATHLNGVSRFKLINALKLNNVNIIPIVINTPLKVCLERNAKRVGREKVPEDALRRMYFSMTDPANDSNNTDYEYYDILYYDYKEGN